VLCHGGRCDAQVRCARRGFLADAFGESAGTRIALVTAMTSYRRFFSFFVLAVTCLAASPLVACYGGDVDAEAPPTEEQTSAVSEATIDTAAVKWTAQGMRDYDFEFETGGFAAHEHVRIQVRGGLVAHVESLVADRPTRSATNYPTIDSLLVALRAAAKHEEPNAYRLTEATFDTVTGAPSKAAFANTSESWYYEVTNFVASSK
jgi:hypothetical protein